MPDTFTVARPEIKGLDSYLAHRPPVTMLEGANQTFARMTPVVITGGYVVAAASPVTAVYGFALEAGHNTTPAGSSLIQVVPVVAGLTFFANFLDKTTPVSTLLTLATTHFDLSLTYRMVSGAVLPDGGTTFYVNNETASTQAVRIVSLETDQFKRKGLSSDATGRIVPYGDSNVRIEFEFIQSVANLGAVS